MDQNAIRPAWGRAGSALLACTMLTAPALLHAQPQIERPGIAAKSTDLGPIQPAAPIKLTVHLNMRDPQAFEQAVHALYTRGSPTYHHWMTNSEIAAYAPAAADVQSVVSALKSNGLTVLSVAPDNLSIRVQGATSVVESAFQTQLHQFEYQGKTFHANVKPAALAGAAGSLVRGVTGLANIPMQSYLKHQVNPRTGKPLVTQLATGSGFSGVTNNCFGAPTEVTLTTAGATLPYGQYTGNTYNSSSGALCSWTPSQVQAHYGFTAAYSQGLDGTGQTIVIVDGPTDGAQLQSDLALFATMAGLPAITSSNFTVLYPDGQPSAAAIKENSWQEEASLDVEWAHSLAPGAHIVIEILPSQDWDEFEFAIDYARQNSLGNVISNSYGQAEGFLGASTVRGFEQVLKKAAAAGIAVNFASGDSADLGTGAPNAGADSYPGSSAYVTSVGGTAIGIPNSTVSGAPSIGAEIGWGNQVTYLSAALDAVLDPPLQFVPTITGPGGSGGGTSLFFAKPSWQNTLSGTARQSPDIAALADPETGVVFVLGGTAHAGLGGTSLACPIFSAVWAIADQAAGTSLGQAAPLLYTLPSTAINDVVPVGSATNVSGFIVDANGQTNYSPNALLGPLYTTTEYYSALLNVGGGEYAVVSFATDASLTVTPGWDNVTGLGVPNGVSFIDALVNPPSTVSPR
jgi:subtilase family serine protease